MSELYLSRLRLDPRHRLVDWCRVLLNLNEFVYPD